VKKSVFIWREEWQKKTKKYWKWPHFQVESRKEWPKNVVT